MWENASLRKALREMRNAALEEAAKIIEDNVETCVTAKGTVYWVLRPRDPVIPSVTGLTYAKAIRALKESE